MIEKFQLIEVKPPEKITLLPLEYLKLMHNSIKLYRDKKVKSSLHNLIDLFLADIRESVTLSDRKTAFVPVYIPDYPLVLSPTVENNAIVNFGFIKEFPTYEINLLYAILFYSFGYYIGVKTYSQRQLILDDMSKILFNMVLRMFGRSHSILSLDDWKFEAIRYVLSLHVYRRIGGFTNVASTYGKKIISSFSLKYPGKLSGLKISDERLDNIEDVLYFLSVSNIIHINKNIYTHRIYTSLGIHGLIMFDNYYRFCAQLFAIVYPTKMFSTYIKSFNKKSYDRILNRIISNAEVIEWFDPNFLRNGVFK